MKYRVTLSSSSNAGLSYKLSNSYQRWIKNMGNGGTESLTCNSCITGILRIGIYSADGGSLAKYTFLTGCVVLFIFRRKGRSVPELPGAQEKPALSGSILLMYV